MKIGDKAYIIQSGQIIVRVEIISINNSFYVCKLPSGGAIRLRKSRLYESENEAKDHILKHEIDYNPWDYMKKFRH